MPQTAWYVLQWEHEGVDAEWASPLTVIDDFEIKSRIVVVGACELTQSGDLAQTDYSNTGARVDLLAPGGGASSPITSALAGGTPYGPMTGTSMASPHAAGAAALALAIDPNLTGPEVKELLRRASQTEAPGGRSAGAGRGRRGGTGGRKRLHHGFGADRQRPDERAHQRSRRGVQRRGAVRHEPKRAGRRVYLHRARSRNTPCALPEKAI